MIASVSKVMSLNPVANGTAAAAVRPGADDSARSAAASTGVESVIVKISVAGDRWLQPTPGDKVRNASSDNSGVKADQPAADKPFVANSIRQGIVAKLYRDADANQDGMVSVLESSAYNFINPSLPSPERLDELAGNGTAVTELQAYVSVASAGRLE